MAPKRPSVVALGLLAKPGEAPARATPIEDLPRPASPRASQAASPDLTLKGPDQRLGKGIKAATLGTTIYLLPAEHKRVRRLALDMDVPSVHELLLMGLDRLFAEHGQEPIERYSQPRKPKS